MILKGLQDDSNVDEYRINYLNWTRDRRASAASERDGGRRQFQIIDKDVREEEEEEEEREREEREREGGGGRRKKREEREEESFLMRNAPGYYSQLKRSIGECKSAESLPESNRIEPCLNVL